MFHFSPKRIEAHVCIYFVARIVCNYTLICCKDIIFISNQSTDYLFTI